MSTLTNLKSKVINTLNILSGQDVMETKLYKTILSAKKEDKGLLIELSSSFAATFANFGKSLKTTDIYLWLKPIFDRFAIDGKIDLADLVIMEKMETIGFEPISYKNPSKGIFMFDNSSFVGHDYVKIWTSYFYDDRSSKIEKIIKIIKPIELFILTAITVIALACHIDQKPFEYYANIDFKLILCTLVINYLPLHRSAYEKYAKLNKDTVDNEVNVQYIILKSLIDDKDCKKNLEDLKDIKSVALKGRYLDEIFSKLINVSEKSEYEILKLGYKK